MKTQKILLAALLLAGTVVNKASAQYPVSAHVSPTDDSYVRDGIYSNTNYGSYGVMESRTTSSTDYNRIVYLSFDVSQASPDVESVKVRVYGSYSGTGSVPVGIYSVASTTWSQGTITWNNRPATSLFALATTYVTNTPQFWEWDVTNYVRNQRLAGKTKVSFVLKNQVSTSYIISWSPNEAFYQWPVMEIVNEWVNLGRSAGELQTGSDPDVRSENNTSITDYPPVVHEGAWKDTYVRDGIYANDDFYGSYGVMETRTTASTGFNRISYLTFDVSQASPCAESVKVRIYGSYTGTGTIPVGIYSVASTGWSNISWNTRPATSLSALATAYVGSSPQFWEWDVTSYVRNQRLAGKTKVSFALKNQVSTPYIASWSSSNAFAQHPDMEIINVWIPKQPNAGRAITSVQQAEKHELLTYPNPARENLAVVFESTSNENVSVSILDVMSKKVAAYNVVAKEGSNKVNLDLPQLENGIYFLILEQGTKKESKRIVIKK